MSKGTTTGCSFFTAALCLTLVMAFSNVNSALICKLSDNLTSHVPTTIRSIISSSLRAPNCVHHSYEWLHILTRLLVPLACLFKVDVPLLRLETDWCYHCRAFLAVAPPPANFHWANCCSPGLLLAFCRQICVRQLFPLVCFLGVPFPWNCQLDYQDTLLGWRPQADVRSQCGGLVKVLHPPGPFTSIGIVQLAWRS